MFIAVLFILTKNWKKKNHSFNRWMEKPHPYNGKLLSDEMGQTWKQQHRWSSKVSYWVKKKKAILKVNILHDYIYITFSKGQKPSDGIRPVGAELGMGGGCDYKGIERGCFRVMILFCIMIVLLITWIFTCVKIHRTLPQEGQFYYI